LELLELRRHLRRVRVGRRASALALHHEPVPPARRRAQRGARALRARGARRAAAPDAARAAGARRGRCVGAVAPLSTMLDRLVELDRDVLEAARTIAVEPIASVAVLL